jgi:hypothetical protein
VPALRAAAQLVDERGALGGYPSAGTPFSLKRRAPAEGGPSGLNVRPGRSKRGPRAGALEPHRLVLQPQPDCQPPPFATSSRIRPGTPPMHFLAQWEPRHGLGHCAPGASSSWAAASSDYPTDEHGRTVLGRSFQIGFVFRGMRGTGTAADRARSPSPGRPTVSLVGNCGS